MQLTQTQKQAINNDLDQLLDLIDDLGTHFDDFPSEAQDQYEQLAKLVGTKQYRYYSDQFADVDPHIVTVEIHESTLIK